MNMSIFFLLFLKGEDFPISKHCQMVANADPTARCDAPLKITSQSCFPDLQYCPFGVDKIFFFLLSFFIPDLACY